MNRFLTSSRIGLGLAWLLLCLLAWWCGRTSLFSGQPANTPAPLSAETLSAASVQTSDDKTSAAAVDEDTISAALAEIHRLTKNSWGSSSDLANYIRQGQKFRYAQSLPIPVLRGVLQRLVDDPSDENGSLAFELAQNVLLELDSRGAYDIMMAVIGLKLPGVNIFPSLPLSLFADKAPHEAAAYWLAEYQKNPPPEWIKTEQLGNIFRALAFRDFDAALRAAEKLPDPELQRTALAGLPAAMTTFFPEDRVAWRSNEEARELVQKIIAAAGESARHGLNAALSARMRSEEPAATLAWYESLELSPENRPWASKSLVDAWMQKAPADAWTWYVAQAPPEQRSDALDRAIRKWTETEAAPFRDMPRPDLAACSEWLIGQGLGETSQQAMSTLARAYAKQYEPEAALAWARAIPSEEIRQTAEREVATEIKKRFPAQWHQWLPEPH